MALTVTNTASANAQRHLSRNTSDLQRVIERLASGSRINSARDDSAGLSISTRLTSQIRGVGQAVRNGNDGISLAQTAESALGDVEAAVLRIRELSVQAANDANSEDDRANLQAEVAQLVSEVDRIATSTSYNNREPISGRNPSTFLHIGPNARETLEVGFVDARASTIGSHVRVKGTEVRGLALGVGDVEINGIEVRPTEAVDDTLSTAERDGSVIAKAKAINAVTRFTGVSAIANRAEYTGIIIGGGVLNEVNFLTLNGETISGFTVENNDASGALLSAINAVADTTGVVASVDDQRRIVLTAEDGRNIEATASGTAQASTGVSTGTTSGTLTLSSPDVITLTLTGDGSIAIGHGSGAGGDILLGDVRANALSTVDVTTRDGANRGIEISDQALRQTSNFRGRFGAISNRLESVLNHLSVRGENLSAARSRIVDADFASEAAELARSTFLRETGVSVLAIANVTGNAALRLLS